jgi:hypothetical protein
MVTASKTSPRPTTIQNNVSILIGNGAGNFSAATNFPAGLGAGSVAVSDFNGDGKQDLAVANGNSNTVSILLGNGSGSFSAPTNFGAGDAPTSIVVGDFNGDGKKDLAVVNYVFLPSSVSILLGNGTGGFSAAAHLAVSDLPFSLAVGDFNRDGDQDLAVTQGNSSSVAILLGNGAGGFSAPTPFAVGLFPVSVAVGDFNGDGSQDLAVANYTSSSVSILLGNGTGSFSAATNFGVENYPDEVVVGDFNGDGEQDLATPNFDSDNVSILLGNGAGSFGAATNFASGDGASSVAVGDFNGDGMQDLAVADSLSDKVLIQLRTCTPNTPTSALSRKTHGAAGNFDISLPLSGTAGRECRSGGTTNDFTMRISFPGNVAVTGSPQAQVTMGTGAIGTGGTSNGGMVTVSGSVVTVPLTNINNGQTINVRLNSVNGSGYVVIPMSVLVGDSTAGGVVNSADVTQTKVRVGQSVTTATFRSDVNANGTVNAGDVSLVKARVGTALP